MGETIRDTAAAHKIGDVFVACAPHFMGEALPQLKLYNPNLTFHTFTSEEPPFKGHPDVVGMAETQICVDAPVFIGNAWSTWSRTVHQQRSVSVHLYSHVRTDLPVSCVSRMCAHTCCCVTMVDRFGVWCHLGHGMRHGVRHAMQDVA